MFTKEETEEVIKRLGNGFTEAQKKKIKSVLARYNDDKFTPKDFRLEKDSSGVYVITEDRKGQEWFLVLFRNDGILELCMGVEDNRFRLEDKGYLKVEKG